MAIDKRELDMVDGHAKPTGNHRTTRCWVPRLRTRVPAPRAPAPTPPPDPGPARTPQPARIGHLSVLDAPRPGAHEAQNAAHERTPRDRPIDAAQACRGGPGRHLRRRRRRSRLRAGQRSANQRRRPPLARDKEVLQFALKLEHLQTASTARRYRKTS